MGKVRYDQDKKGDVCNTVDAVFHPDAYVLARNKSFQAMMINIALDTSQKQLGERKETISKDYVILQNVKCKGGEPALLPVRSIHGRIVSKGEGEPQRDLEGRETNLQR
jgi:dynein assembly factor 2